MSQAARFIGGCAIIDGPSMEPYMRGPTERVHHIWFYLFLESKDCQI